MKRIQQSMLPLLASLFVATSAHAVAPANSTITNTASLTYTGLATPISSSVDVTVTLVPTAPNATGTGGVAPTATVAENQPGTLTFVVTATANGPDTYNLGANSTPTNVTGSGAPTTSVPSLTLGATAVLTAAPAGATAITVPADGAADGSVNGLIAGDTVVIGGTVYTIASVVDNAAGTSTITLTTPLAAPAPQGTLIAEQKTVTVTQTAGLITAPAITGNETVALTATSATNPAVGSTSTGTINVVKVGFTKSVSVNGGAFQTVVQNVKSGDVLTYRLLVSVPAGSTISGVTLSDTVPAFTTYVAASTTMDVDGPNVAINLPAAQADVAGVSPLAAGMAVNSAGQAAGTVAGGAATVTEVSVDFQVTVQ